MAQIYLMFRGEYEDREVEGAYTSRPRAEAAWRALQDAFIDSLKSRCRDRPNDWVLFSIDRETRREPDIEERELVEGD